MLCKYSIKIGKRIMGINTSLPKTKALAKTLIFFFDNYIGTALSVLSDIEQDKREYNEEDIIQLDAMRENFVRHILSNLRRDPNFAVDNIKLCLEKKTEVVFEVHFYNPATNDKYIKYKINHICDGEIGIHTTYEMEKLLSSEGFGKYRVRLHFHFE